MPDITIYSTTWCGHCRRAKHLLDSLGADYTEVLVDQDDGKMTEMLEKSGGRKTVPQIFIGPSHIGGADDLLALHADGGLEPLLEEEL